MQSAGGATEQGRACDRLRQGGRRREQANVLGHRAGCKRNAGAGSLAAVSEPSSRTQAAMCPISARSGGGGLFAAEEPARMSERRPMCLRWSVAQCPPPPQLFGAANEEAALPPLGASPTLRSGAPCALPPQSLAII